MIIPEVKRRSGGGGNVDVVLALALASSAVASALAFLGARTFEAVRRHGAARRREAGARDPGEEHPVPKPEAGRDDP
ncbi:MAG: hypothetical protein IT373_17855 [Polyangiaceae bacterium]|nr:hypothetical protein [Polyangiaceae bacterium]